MQHALIVHVELCLKIVNIENTDAVFQLLFEFFFVWFRAPPLFGTKSAFTVTKAALNSRGGVLEGVLGLEDTF